MDRVLRGGCACGSITELVGPAGIGKTQLCLQLAAIAASLPVDAQSNRVRSQHAVLLLQCCLCHSPQFAAVHITVGIARHHQWQVEQKALLSAILLSSASYSSCS